jgi:hypothetical protein
MKYEIGKVYEFDGEKRKVIGVSGGYPVTTKELEKEVQPQVVGVDVEKLREEIREELTKEFESDYHSRPASPDAYSGLISLLPLDKFNKDELQAVAAYIGKGDVVNEELSKGEMIAIITGS